MPVVLVSGFDAWGDLVANPAWLAVDAAEPTLPTDWELRKVQIPVSWDHAFDPLLDAWTPDVAAVLAFGVAQITDIALEQIAINLTDGEDVDGQLSPSKEVIPDGPAAYLSTLPLDSLYQTLSNSGLKVAKSAHAGTFLCNSLFYQVIHHALWTSPEIPAGFIHLSNLRPSESLDQADLTRAVEIAIETTVQSCSRVVG